MPSRPPRFWPLAALIVLPVLVLAGVAAWGLEQRRMAQREEAAQRCPAESFHNEWANASNIAMTSAPVTVLYDDPPAPRAPAEDDYVLDYWIEGKPMEGRAHLKYNRTPDDVTASGLPVYVLAQWQKLQKRLAEKTPPPDLEKTAGDFFKLIVVEKPSALSTKMIEHLAPRWPEAAARWRREWNLMEVRRAALREANPPPRSNTVALAIPYTAEELMAPPEAGFPYRKFGDREALGGGGLRSSVAVIHRIDAGSGTVLLAPELRAAFQAMQEKTKHMLPDWATVTVQTVPSITLPSGPRHQAMWLGPYIADVVSRHDIGLYVIETGPRERGWLMRDYYQLLAWAVALIGTALITAITGLSMVHRTLHKERRLGELKSQFVSSVSHELRAPVGSLRLMADGLASGKVTGAAADEFHRLMAGVGARLSSLIENVLDFARIEQGRKEYHMAETDIAALVQDAVKLMTPQAEARGLSIVCECESLTFVPRVDAGAVQQALINLLDNAIKFLGAPASPPAAADRSILVFLTAAGGTPALPGSQGWSITVSDKGPGIPKEEHARIFERFYRLGNELRRETTGTGIGLAIVKHIVEGHGGRVEVESELGKGSEFRMLFPGEVISDQ